MKRSYHMRISVLIFAALCSLGLFLPSPSHAALSPEEILRKADEARGNLEGVVWEIEIKSIERGREQDRTI
ncbi:MAG: hypothetical protein P8Y09_01655, partial [Deltaproteobacteria bacterium]